MFPALTVHTPCSISVSGISLTALVAPRSFSNPRQRAQRGVFTRLTHQQRFDLASYLAERGEDGCLTRWEVPATEAAVALDDLRMANITPATLFPDLNGAATEANAAYEAVFAAAVLQRHDGGTP